MEKIRYYTYLETLKNLTGELILFDNTSNGNDRKLKLICERYGRMLRLLRDKGYLDGSLFEVDGCSDPEELYSNIALLTAYLFENKK